MRKSSLRTSLHMSQVDGAKLYRDNGRLYLHPRRKLEQGLVATDYIETTTTSVSAGILEDMPRLDYSGGASCPSLLLEPQRTNLLTHRSTLVVQYWAKHGTEGGNAPVGYSKLCS